MDFIEILEKTYKLVEFVETKFSKQLTKRETDHKHEIDFNFFFMNPEKKYVGAFFERDAKDIYVWVGYDIATEHFCISFCSSQQEILKQVLENSHFSYSSYEGHWYSIFVDAIDFLTDSDNKISSSEFEQSIKNILDKFDEILSKETK